MFTDAVNTVGVIETAHVFVAVIQRFDCCFQGSGVEAHGPDGGGEPPESVRQRPHLPRQLHLCQLRLRDLHVSR